MSSLLGFDNAVFQNGAWDSGAGAEGLGGAGMNLNHWQDGVWAEGSHVPEAWGSVAAEEGIGLATVVHHPVDFVLQSPHWAPRTIRPFGKVRVLKKNKSDLQEMLQMYAKWKMAA